MTPSASSIRRPTASSPAPPRARREARFEDVPLGGTRRLVSPQAAFAFALDGLDAAMLEAPAPPAWESAAFATEAIETYWMALLRDVPFGAYGDDPLVARAVADLSRSGRNVTPRTLFGRLPTPDSRLPTPESRLPGPAVSQFLLRAVPMGAQLLSPRVPAQAPGESFLSTWDEWLASQNGRLPSREATYTGRRYICCGRDLATWTRTDYPGQAGVQAALLLEALRAPVTPQHPYVRSRNQAGYVTFGLPFIVDLASRVAMHALRASWFQKWVLHRRLRPEELGGRLEAGAAGAPIVAWPDTRFVQSDAFAEMRRRTGTCLLPMAWPEGAPLHPAYPSAHAATAGAMVTVLKAYYAEEWVMPDVVEPSLDGSELATDRCKPHGGRRTRQARLEPRDRPRVRRRAMAQRRRGRPAPRRNRRGRPAARTSRSPARTTRCLHAPRVRRRQPSRSRAQ